VYRPYSTGIVQYLNGYHISVYVDMWRDNLLSELRDGGSESVPENPALGTTSSAVTEMEITELGVGAIRGVLYRTSYHGWFVPTYP
jgi:hypothetical protein